MTREEIIQGLQFTINMFLFDPNIGETLTEPRNNMDAFTIDACRGAIELLEQGTCEDAVSREDVLMCMTGEYLVDREYKSEDIISKHIRRVKALPLVYPKQKTGHWIEDENEMKVWCSECGEDSDNCSKCCPNCGKRMIESEDKG